MSRIYHLSDYRDDKRHSYGTLVTCIVSFALVLVLWILIFEALAHAQPRYKGFDLLALQSPRYDVKGITELLPKNTALGTLHNTFGADTAPIDYVLSSGKVGFYRVHLLDGTCLPLRTCGGYTPIRGLSVSQFDQKVGASDSVIFKYFHDSTLIYCGIAAKYPSIRTVISPVLEHRLSVKSWTVLYNYIHGLCPALTITNNSVLPGLNYKTGYIETHDINPKQPFALASTDGADVLNMNYKAWNAKTGVHSTLVQYVHSATFNCRGPGPFIDPRQRKNCVTTQTFKKILGIVK